MKLDIALLAANLFFAYYQRGTFTGWLNTIAAALLLSVIIIRYT